MLPKFRATMKKRMLRLLIQVLVGMMILSGMVWILSKTLGNAHYPTLYAGKTMEYWQQQLYGHDSASSNAAFVIVSTQLVPQLVDSMFHDTNDSSARLSLIKTLNGLPGVHIDYVEAADRRVEAVQDLGDLGAAAKSALPDLIRALKGQDAAIRAAAISSLGKIRSEPDTVIPLLIPYLEEDELDAPAAQALGEFGGLARPAVPKLLPLLQGKDKGERAAAREALLKIDPEAAAKAGIKTQARDK
jgi:hypothetical protein